MRGLNPFRRQREGGIHPYEYTDAELDALVEEMALNVERARSVPERDVIGAMVEAGCPRRDAEAQMKGPMAMYARRFYLDVQDAALGNAEARERVERCREAWGTMTRRAEMQR